MIRLSFTHLCRQTFGSSQEQHYLWYVFCVFIGFAARVYFFFKTQIYIKKRNHSFPLIRIRNLIIDVLQYSVCMVGAIFLKPRWKNVCASMVAYSRSDLQI